jgi:hypothetical protein
MRGCLRKSLFSLMISTLERFALLEVGGRLGVATQVTVSAPRALLLPWEGWRVASPLAPPAKALLDACMSAACARDSGAR